MATESQPVYSIGYGRRSIYEFIDLLHRYGVTRLVDIRSHPVSRWNPAFRKKILEEYLTGAGIKYTYRGDVLGGKPADPDLWVGEVLDLDVLWEKPWFHEGIGELEAASRGGERLAVMCAELRPESCHRAFMVGAALIERGVEMRHIDEHGGIKSQIEVLGWFSGHEPVE